MGPDQTILEIWIENLKICINEKNMAFHSPTPRMAINHFGTFNLPDQFCEIVKELVQRDQVFQTNNIKIFENLRNQLSGRKHKHSKVTK